MDSNKLNMIAGGLIGSLLAFLLLNFFTHKVYESGGHGAGETLAFAVEVEDVGGGEAAAAEVDLAALVAAADPAQGEKLFKKCSACHSTAEGEDKAGPSLYRIVGRAVAAEPGFGYSDAMAGHGGAWDLETLSHFLENPKGFIPGTKMGFAGLSKAEDRVNLIVYLNEAGGAPVPLAQ